MSVLSLMPTFSESLSILTEGAECYIDDWIFKEPLWIFLLESFHERFTKRYFVMEWKVFFTVFGAVFIAELGDKTQLATLLFAADKEVSKLTVFFAASLALIVATGIGVLAGGLMSTYINERYLKYIAGIGFIVIGLFVLFNNN